VGECMRKKGEEWEQMRRERHAKALVRVGACGGGIRSMSPDLDAERALPANVDAGSCANCANCVIIRALPLDAVEPLSDAAPPPASSSPMAVPPLRCRRCCITALCWI